MAGGSPQRAGAESFTAPQQLTLNQRRYEALRAFFVDGLDLTVRTANQAEEYLDLPVLASLSERRRRS